MPSVIRVELPEGSPYGESFDIQSPDSFRGFVRRINRHQLIPAGVRKGEIIMIPSESVVRLHKVSDT